MSRLRVAVTGAGGRVGSALVAKLAAHGEFDVVAVVRNALTARLFGSVDADIRIGSVTDPVSSREVLAGCDAVVNCALAKGWPATARRQNNAIVRNIADVPGVRRVVHFSTVAVYGMCVDPRVSTFERPRPDSSYGADKLCLERLATRLFSARGIRHYIVRLGHVYGPSQWVSRDVLERVRDPSFALPFGGDNPSNAVSIEAVVAAVRNLLSGDLPSGIRNLVDSPQSSWRTLYDLHAGLLERPPAGSMSEAESQALRERCYAAAKEPLRTIARGVLSAFGSVNLVALAQIEAFRHIVHGPLILLPGPVGAAINRAYVRRKVRGALRQALPSRALPPGLMCAPAIPGPCFPTLDSSKATAAMADELRTWLRGLWSYRWDPAVLGPVPDGVGTRKMPATIATETDGRDPKPPPDIERMVTAQAD
jgi:nucleoside-diphosphate-sugar epimerase